MARLFDRFKSMTHNIMGNPDEDNYDVSYYEDNGGEEGFVDINGNNDADTEENFDGNDVGAESFVAPVPPTEEPKRIKVVLFKPLAYDTVLSEMAAVLKSGDIVLVNLEDTTKEMSRRIIDFISGVAYALEGQINKIAMNTYIVTPRDVEVIGDALASELANIAANNDSGTIEIQQ